MDTWIHVAKAAVVELIVRWSPLMLIPRMNATNWQGSSQVKDAARTLTPSLASLASYKGFSCSARTSSTSSWLTLGSNAFENACYCFLDSYLIRSLLS